MIPPRATSRSSRSWRIALALGAALIGILSMPVSAQAHALRGCKLADPTGGGVCSTGPVKLSTQDLAIGAAKTKLANEYAAAWAGKLSYTQYWKDMDAFLSTYHLRMMGSSLSPNCISQPGGGCAPASRSLGLIQQAQINNYYCGPATASEILRTLGITDSQSTLAGNAFLETNTYGQTPWTDNSGASPMKNTLNNLQNANFYYPVNGSGVGGGFSQSTYQADLVWDIAGGWPVAGNVYEPANGAHLWGHPEGQTIGHWIALYGYSKTDCGADTSYADSVYGSVINWPVQPYNAGFSSATMTSLLNGRGFVW